MNAENGAPCSVQHLKKKQFIESVKRGVNTPSSSKQITEAAAIAAVKLCKISTYIPVTEPTNCIFILVQFVLADLKVRE